MSPATLAAVHDKFVMRVVNHNALAEIPGFTANFKRSAEVYAILGSDHCIITATRSSALPSPPAPSTPTTTNKPNVSTLAFCPVGGVVTAGFVLADASSQQVLIRAIGPSLAPLGGVLPNPRLTVNKGTVTIKTNDDWGTTAAEVSALKAAFTAVGAFGLANGSKDSAVLLRLDAGAYTVQADSTDAGASGLVLLEVYVIKN
ncbi:MAG: hypothetical protein Q8N18_07730 [Opitutaceae bacterium]|nr:hypothetical protein [Opitutaceae bacterium]